MDREHLTVERVVSELRKIAGVGDIDFAKEVAYACDTVADRECSAGRDSGVAIRALFQVD